MYPFNYSTPNMYEILAWQIDQHGFVQVNVIKLQS
jgi:hypothetical protein